LAALSIAVSLEKRTDERVPVSMWIRSGLLAFVMMGGLLLAFYFAGRFLW
jgi:hypothetical protein